ncbi:MAG: TPM domain-containing protein [Bacteroides sp.]|nr:TPM domain-containing protein [Roseburia sp.]MCM1346570.1 TPM domain-containing protein [Bacteroides sp.]MCM1420552.1 TPM domain-containing protein [Bacteroides sp.]
MKRFFSAYMLSLWMVMAVAGVYTPENLPVSGNVSRVCNPDGLLLASTVDSIDAMLLALDKKQVQCLVVVIRNIEGDNPYDFAIGVGRRYGIGGKKSQGIVVVLATDDRSYQIVTGDGMEKFLPDAICKRIENREMVPWLKKGKWDEAMLSTIKAIKGIVDGEPELMAEYTDDSLEDEEILKVLGFCILIMLLGIVVIAVVFVLSEKKCAYCGKYKLKVTSRKTYKDTNGVRHIQTICTCGHCHKVTVKDKVERNDGNEGFGGGIFPGGMIMGGGRGYGGGSSGGFGSFGGGSFGGGGAGGRF